MSPIVSILVPSYNLGRFLPETLESIRAQTFQDFECIIGDDGSSEPIRDIVDVFLKDKRFSFIQWQPNRGAHPAIRFLYTQAKGSFWCPFSSDDVYEKDFLEKRLAVMNVNPMAGLVFGRAKIIDERGTEHPDRSIELDLPPRLPSPQALGLLLQHNIVSGPGVMLRAEAARQILPLYTSNWPYTQDWLMWILMAATGFDFVWDLRPLVKYRMRTESLNRPPQEMAPAAGAEARLLTLWAFSMASRYSVDASLLWMKWRTALYHLWLRRAVNLRMKGALRDEWMQLAARCFYGEGAKPVSLPYELIRHQPGLAITWHRESRARARQKLCVAGNALLDDPLFRK